MNAQARVRALHLAAKAANDTRIGAFELDHDPVRQAPGGDAARAARWPLLALLAWGSAWALFALLRSAEAPVGVAALTASTLAALWMLAATTPMRRAIVLLGFPLSLLASGAGAGLLAELPAWAWLAPLALLALVYPMRSWRDAPLFPTPPGALDALARHAPLPAGARIHDAGCGLGHGLAALRRAYPEATLDGIERSAPVAWLAAWRARRPGVRATVTRGDMWAADWHACGLVYLFQRPESLPRAVVKARAELAPGAWLVSLEFPALDLAPDSVVTCPDGRALWLYRAPFTATRSSASSITRSPAARMPRSSATRRERR